METINNVTYVRSAPMADARMTYSIEDAAEVLGVGRTTMYRLVAEGEVESIAIGSRRLIPRESIEDFLSRKLAESRALRSSTESS